MLRCTSDDTSCSCSRYGVSARLVLFSTVLVDEVFCKNIMVQLLEPPVRSVVGSMSTFIA